MSQYEQLVLPLQELGISQPGDTSSMPLAEPSIVRQTTHGSTPVLVEAFMEDFTATQTEPSKAGPDVVATPGERLHFLNRVGNLAVEASYKAGAIWATLSKRNKAFAVAGSVISAYMAAKVGGSLLDHSSVAHTPHLANSSYTFNPDQIHQPAGIHAQMHPSPGFTAELNGHPLATPHTPHLISEMNAKSLNAHVAQSPLLSKLHLVSELPTSHRPTFFAEINHKPISSSDHMSNVAHLKTAAHVAHGSQAAEQAHTAGHHHQPESHDQDAAQHYKHTNIPTPGTNYTMRSGDNPWTISQRALGIPLHSHLSWHQIQQIWHYDQHLMRLNHILSEEDAEDLPIGLRLLLPKLY